MPTEADTQAGIRGCSRATALACSVIFNRVEESRSRLEFEIRRLLHEISRVAEQALTRARSARAAGTEAVRGALARLDEVESEIRDSRPTPFTA